MADAPAYTSGRSVPMTRRSIHLLALLLAGCPRPRRAIASRSARPATRRPRRRRCPTPTCTTSSGRFAAARGRAEGRAARAVRAPEPGLSRHAAHLVGLRAGAVRRRRAGQPDDLQRRPGAQGHGGRDPRAQRARQPDLPARDPGDARRSSSIRAGRRNSRSRRRRSGATGRRTARPNTTRSTTSTRA